MTPVTGQPRVAMRRHRLLVWMRGCLFTAGALAISYVGLTLLQAKLHQKAASDTLDKQIHSREQNKLNPPRAAVKEGDVLGRIEIPRLNIKVAILEGTTSQTLRLGVGHIEGTALPGDHRNIGIAGHRDTYFRGLKDIRASDEIQIQTATGLFRYQVDWVRIVAPGDTEVLAPSAGTDLTLVTCYPFYFIGAAPKRFVVHARSAELK